MNYLKLTMIALALCLCMVLPVAATGYDYTSKYVNNDPANSVAPLDASGWVAFSIIAGGAQDRNVWVVNKAVNATPFDCKFNPDKSSIAGQNPQYKLIVVPGSGTTGALQWAVGEFDAYLQNGNGNQCEHIAFKAGGGGPMEATNVVFQGAAVSQLGETEGVCQREVIKAEYGAFEKRCQKICEEVLVSPEHDEYRWDSWFYGSSDWTDTKPCYWDYILKRNKETRNIPAKYESQCKEVCETIGGSTDVTANINEALSQGYTSFLFDNAHTPGGIFDITTTTLLSTIPDPAPGIVKHVSITYKDCSGAEQNVEAEEYETITL